MPAFDGLTAKIDLSASGDSAAIVAAPADPRFAIVVDDAFLVAKGAVDVVFKSGSTPLTGPMNLPATGNGFRINVPFACAPGQALVINLSVGVVVGGFLRYHLQ